MSAPATAKTPTSTWDNQSDDGYQVSGGLPEEGQISSLVELSAEGAARLREIMEAAPGPNAELARLLREG